MKNNVHMFDNDEAGFLECATTTLDQLKNMNGVVNICWAYIVYALGYQSAKSSIIESDFDVGELIQYNCFCADIRSKMGMNTDAMLVFCFPEGPDSKKYYAMAETLKASLESNYDLHFMGIYSDQSIKPNSIKTILMLCTSESSAHDERGQK